MVTAYPYQQGKETICPTIYIISPNNSSNDYLFKLKYELPHFFILRKTHSVTLNNLETYHQMNTP